VARAFDPSIIDACARGFRARRDGERARHARRAQALRDRAQAAATRLNVELGVRRVWLFGSLAWGDAHTESDVDLLVDGLDEGAWARAHAIAEQTVGGSVDVVRLEEAPPGLVDRVRMEGVLLHGE
jgi:predicted nucleotidyltransferase